MSPVQSPPPRSASSSSRVTTSEILLEIDSSMSRTLHTIDNEVDTRVIRKKKPPRPLPTAGRPLSENGYRSPPEQKRFQQSQESKLYSEMIRTDVTSTELADKFTGLMSGATSPVVGPSDQAVGTISPEILQAIREQMAVSLQRMRDLEDQVRVMPVMEDQILTLRSENKRLYHLLSRLTEDGQNGGGPIVNGDAGLHIEGDENVRTFRGEQGSILVELPVKVGVDQSSAYSMSSTETRTEVHETKESARRAFFWGTSDAGAASGMAPESLRLFKPLRTVGVGDGNVFEVGSSVDWPAWKKTRDVGVHCQPPSRDVSASISEDLLEEDMSTGAQVSLTVTVSDERRVCEPRWEVERFGAGPHQDVAVQCLIIGGFLTSDRPLMSENVDGWLVETNKLWTYSANAEPAPLPASTHTSLEYQPEGKLYTDDHTSLEDGLVQEQSVSAVKKERQSSSLDGVLSRLYQNQIDTVVEDAISEEKAVPVRANPSTIDLNASFRKLQEKADTEDQMIKEDVIVPQSKLRVSASCIQTAAADISTRVINASIAKLQQEVQEPTVEEDVIVPRSAEPRASSRRVEQLPMEDLTSDRLLSDSGLIHEDKESSVDSSSGVRPFPPHLSRITASSVSDDDSLTDYQPQQDVTVLDTTTTHSVTVVEAPGSTVDEHLVIQSQQGSTSLSADQTLITQTSTVSKGGMDITTTEVTREVTVGSEVTTSSVETVGVSGTTSADETSKVLSEEMTDTGHISNTVESGELQSSGVADSICVDKPTSKAAKTESMPIVSAETVSTAKQSESTVVTAEIDSVQQSVGELAPSGEAPATVEASDQAQGCHIVITETRIERQLIGCDSDQSQPVVIVPEDTVIQ